MIEEEIVNKAIQQVVFRYNAYAPIISSFRIVYSDMVPTAGVDRYARLIINPKFAKEQEAYMEAIIIHEVLHVFFMHTTDARSELAWTDDPNYNFLVNIAEDCAINQFIVEQMPQGMITPRSLSDMLDGVNVPYGETAEKYLEIIKKNMKNQSNGQNCLANGGCSTDQVNSQKIQDELDKMGIKHISEEEVNDKVMDAAKEMAKGRGSQYGALADFARQMLEPKVDWRPLLQAAVRNAEKKIYTIHQHSTYKRTNRRSHTVLMPKKYGHKISVSLSFDTSGSISKEMVNQFLSEIKNCMLHSDIVECGLWHTSNYWYGTPQQLEEDISKVFEWGGTDSKCIEECAKHCKADIGFAFSDGDWGPEPTKPEGCKTNHMMAIIWDDNNIKEIRELW